MDEENESWDMRKFGSDESKNLVVITHLSDMFWSQEFFDIAMELMPEMDYQILVMTKEKEMGLNFTDTRMTEDLHKFLGYKNIFFVDSTYNLYHYIIQKYLDSKSTYRPRIHTYWHGGFYEPYDHARDRQNVKPFERQQFIYSDTALVQTEYHKNLILRSYPEFEWKIKVMPFTVGDTAKEFDDGNRGKGAGFVGRQTFDKGFDLIPDMVEVFRSKEKDDYYKFLSDKRCMVLPARKETYGLCAMEAIQAGTIPILPYKRVYEEIYGSELLESISFKKYDESKIVEKIKDINSWSYEKYHLTLAELKDTVSKYTDSELTEDILKEVF